MLAWGLRPFAYAAVLEVAPRDGCLIAVDPHGYGLSWDMLVHAASLPFLLLGLRWLARRRGGVRTDGWRAALSWVAVLLVGTPSLSGAIALRGLPLSLSWPVALSSILWLVVCVLLREAWAGRGRDG